MTFVAPRGRRILGIVIAGWVGLVCPVEGQAESQSKARDPRHLIVMIADGAGYNTFAAASMYQGRWSSVAKRSVGQVYDGPAWVKLAKAAWSLSSTAPGEGWVPDDSRRYDPRRAWDGSWIGDGDKREGFPDHFEGYRWHKTTAPDSASTMTHMMTGAKTYDGAINVDAHGQPLESLAEVAKKRGFRIGIVSSVIWCHATPAAAGGAHNTSRESYFLIANEMLSGATLDLVFGAGHPEYTRNGRPITPREPMDFLYVGGKKTWHQLKNGEHPGGWSFFDDKKEFESLAWTGRRIDGTLPERLIGIARVRETLQMQRAGLQKAVKPFDLPPNGGVPTLPIMATGALRALTRDDAGFFLLIEGGAVDWAMHANHTVRMIEEMIEFNRAVEAVVEWIEKESSWEETLVIITADHDHMIFGPQSDRFPFQPLQDRGVSEVPGHKWHYNSHSNQLVPVYARGVGANHLNELADQEDPVRGRYIDDVEIAKLLRRVLRQGEEGSR